VLVHGCAIREGAPSVYADVVAHSPLAFCAVSLPRRLVGGR
jgi:hypothetical protein